MSQGTITPLYNADDGGSYSYDSGASFVPSVPITQNQLIPSRVGESSDYQVTSTPPEGTGAFTGSRQVVKPISANDISNSVKESVLRPMGIDFDRKAGLDVWEQQAAQRENRAPRMTNLFDEEYDVDGSGLGWLDNQLNYVGNTPTNDTYLRAAVDKGLSLDDAWAIMHKPGSINEEREMKSSRNVSPDVYKDTGKVIDDGSKYDYAHMTSDKMTGAQYLKYASLGMGGRPVEQIDPSEVYSKRREANEYEFIPFTPDNSTYLNQVSGNVVELPGRLGSMVGNMREAITPDYTISYGGKNGKSFSGRDYDKLARPYMNQFFYNQEFNPIMFLTGQGMKNSTAHVFENVIPDVNGNETYHYGRLRSVDENPDDGTFVLGFSDGSSVNISRDFFDTIYDERTDSVSLPEAISVPVTQARGALPEDLASLNDMDAIMAMVDEYGGSPMDYADVVFLPDLTLSDGTRLTFEDASRIYRDETPEDDKDNDEDDDIGYEFKNTLFFNDKPRRLMDQEPISIGKNGGIEFSDDMWSNAIDWTLGSLPISVGRYLPWIHSLSNASVSLTGANPSTYDPVSDSYGMIAGNYDDNGNMVYGVSDKDGKRDDRLSEETRWWNAAGNAAVPFTEMIVGPVGKQLVPLERIFGKAPKNPTLRQLLTKELIGAAGEGVEEDLGNIFEDLTEYGPSGLFANPIVDENGENVYDQAYHEMRDYDTSLEDRVKNMLDPVDLANAFIGGATVDALMQSPSFMSQVGPAARRSRAIRNTGVRQFVEPTEDDRQAVYDSYLEGFLDLKDREGEV